MTITAKTKNSVRQKENRRDFPRFTLKLPLDIKGPDFQLSTTTVNISCQGVLCQSNYYMPAGTVLHISMRLSFRVGKHAVRKVVKCSAQVARVEPPRRRRAEGKYVLGIAFDAIEAADRRVLLDFIHSKNLREAHELKRMYLELKTMAARLVELEECHPTAERFRKVLDRSILDLDALAHVLDREINELIKLES